MNTLLIIALGSLAGLVISMLILVGILTYRKKLMREELAAEKLMHVSLTLSSSDTAEEADEQRIRHQQ